MYIGDIATACMMRRQKQRRIVPDKRRDSILWQIRLFATGIALSSLLILFAVIYQGTNASAMLDEHGEMMRTGRAVNEFRNTIHDIEIQVMALVGADHEDSEAIDRQIRLFADVQKAGAMGAKLSNRNEYYADIIHPYALSQELEQIAEQALDIGEDASLAEKAAVIDHIENATGNIFQRVDQLSAQAQTLSRDSGQRLRQAIVNVIVMTVLACMMNVVAAVLLTRLMVQRIAKPARAIADATEALAGGNLDVRIPQSKLLELQAIGHALAKFRASAHRERRMAMEDQLSGLPNRRAFFAELEKRLAAAKRNFVLGYVDIDKFKAINDSKGHEAGDALIGAVAVRLQNVVGEAGFVARVGGDEFAIIMELEDFTTPQSIGEVLQDAFNQPFDCGKYVIVATASIGVSHAGAAEKSADTLINEADMALYRAKMTGRDRFALFTQALAERQNLSSRLERDLPEAIRDPQQLHVHYQPILSLDGPPQQEVEALARWNHPELGAISPELFIGIAEECGLIRKLGRRIIHRAFANIAAHPDLSVSINISVSQLRGEKFAQHVLDTARKHRNRPDRVIFEVTESIDIATSEKAVLTLGVLRSMGFRIALDDFGTGYSSLAFMKNYSLDRVKLDRSLLLGLAPEEDNDAVIDAAVAIAKRFGLEIVAEGVETPRHIEQMRNSGCSHLQGFYFARPLPPQALQEFFETGGHYVGTARPAKNKAAA